MCPGQEDQPGDGQTKGHVSGACTVGCASAGKAMKTLLTRIALHATCLVAPRAHLLLGSTHALGWPGTRRGCPVLRNAGTMAGPRAEAAAGRSRPPAQGSIHPSLKCRSAAQVICTGSRNGGLAGIWRSRLIVAVQQSADLVRTPAIGKPTCRLDSSLHTLERSIG